jgi:hypothetical protein
LLQVFMISRSRALLGIALLCLLWPSNSYSQATAQTLSRSFDQLVQESDCVVHGFVVSSRLEPHPQLRNLMTEVVTMKVADTYKGKPQGTLVFRQYVWNTDRGKTALDYHKGEEMVLLLRPVSEYGLTSPAGLEQGRFRITLDRNRNHVAVNGRGNLGLFAGVEQNARTGGVPLTAHLTTVLRQNRPGPLLLTDLEQLVRSFARSR